MERALPFPSLPFPSLPFPSLPFPSLPGSARSALCRSLTKAAAAMATMVCASVGVAQSGPAQRVYSDYEFTSTSGASTTLREVAADVKTPGDGFTYVVATINVEDTLNNPKYSNADVDLPNGIASGFVMSSGSRQVIVVQKTSSSESIVAQRYFWGTTNGVAQENGLGYATNARAIAVHPGTDEADTRVVVCGDTYDEVLPQCLNAPLGNPNFSSGHAAGFIAVYDGGLNLLWTHHFYGAADDGDCAITDVAVHAEEGENGLQDVVTYCGISSHGHPGAGTPLSPLYPFVAPTGLYSSPGGSPCMVLASGSQNNGAGQWDGIVGRLRHDRFSVATTPDFHSILGGVEQDGSFGIALIDANRFIVVGSTRKISDAASSVVFPFTQRASLTAICWNTEDAYHVGTMALFDATATRSGQPLDLDEARWIGSPGAGVHTTATDVCVNPTIGTSLNDPITGMAYIVGATDDSALISSLPGWVPGFQSTLGGGIDGFVLSVEASVPTYSSPRVPGDLSISSASFYGGSDNDVLTGVGSWSEFEWRAVVCGFTAPANGNSDVIVGSVDWLGDRIRHAVFGGSSDEWPSGNGLVQAMVTGVAWESGGLGVDGCGGIAVDSRGRVQVVGITSSSNMPFSSVTNRGRGSRTFADAMRVSFDMLPKGISRTDGTGTDYAGAPVAQPSGFDGGTTPSCAFSPFGYQVDQALAPVKRILFDYHGDAPAGGVSNGVLRVWGGFWGPNMPILEAGVMQIGFPAGGPTVPSGTQLEIWPTNSTAVAFVPSAGYALGTLPASSPAGSMQFTLQAFFLLPSSIPCSSPNPSFVTMGTPGILIHY
jgi:hypothetical protein